MNHEAQAQQRIHGELNAAKPYGMATVRDVQRMIPYATMAADLVTVTTPNADHMDEWDWEQAVSKTESKLRAYAAKLVIQIEREIGNNHDEKN